MPQEYEPRSTLSTDIVIPFQWRFTVIITGLIVIGGALLVVLLALGIADPPYAGDLRWQADSAGDWEVQQQSGDLSFFVAPLPLPDLPFTLELGAENGGTPNSAWGIWLQTAGGVWSLILNNEGYLSVGADEKPRWFEFPHIRRNGTNKLYLNIESNGVATARINDEIGWHGAVNMRGMWGVAVYRAPSLTWQGITVYVS